MSKASLTYIEDAYYRGVWIRELFDLAVYGIEDCHQCHQCDDFLEFNIFLTKWDEYFVATGLMDTRDYIADLEYNFAILGVGANRPYRVKRGPEEVDEESEESDEEFGESDEESGESDDESVTEGTRSG